MTAAEQIRAARGGLTQLQAAKVIGCPLDTLRNWEQGKRIPPEWVLRLVVEKLRQPKAE